MFHDPREAPDNVLEQRTFSSLLVVLPPEVDGKRAGDTVGSGYMKRIN